MARRLSRSHQEQAIDRIAVQRQLERIALHRFFEKRNPELEAFFPVHSIAQLRDELTRFLWEVDLQASLSLLAALEASFRIDYAIRCEKRHKDPLSVHFREIYKGRGNQAHLEEDIISGWQTYTPGSNRLLSELRQAVKFRHWLAHGRYWILKANVDRFTFGYIYSLAQATSESLELHLK